MRPTLRRAVATMSLPLAIASSSGCLSSSYRLAGEELNRLAHTSPDERWQAVRVTQGILDSDHPPPNAAVLPPAPTPVLVMPQTYWYGGRSWGVPSLWRRNNVGTGAFLGSTGSGGGGRGGGSGGSSSGGGSGPGAAVVAVVVIAAAASVFLLAGTEGARYDGWVGLPPDEMVYLQHEGGSVTAVPLHALTPELAASAYGATVYEGRTERYLRLGRAPLNRVGMTLQSGLIGAMIPRSTGYEPGLGGRAFLGGYPVHFLGIGATADVLGDFRGGIVAMVGGELQVMPLLWGGVYAGAGWSSISTEEHPNTIGGWYFRAGLHLELPLTTRLAASLRGGVTRLDFGTTAGALVMPELSIGLSIY